MREKCDSVCFFFRRRRRRLLLLFTVHTGETSAGIMCYINQVTHSVGYPRFVFTNNTPYGRPSNNNILVRFDTFCSLRRETHRIRCELGGVIRAASIYSTPFACICASSCWNEAVSYRLISFAQWIIPYAWERLRTSCAVESTPKHVLLYAHTFIGM